VWRAPIPASIQLGKGTNVYDMCQSLNFSTAALRIITLTPGGQIIQIHGRCHGNGTPTFGEASEASALDLAPKRASRLCIKNGNGLLRKNINLLIDPLSQRTNPHNSLENKKAERAMRPIYRCPENFRESLSTPTATFPEIFNRLLFRSILWMCVQNLKFVALLVPEIIVCTQESCAVPGYAHAPFSF